MVLHEESGPELLEDQLELSTRMVFDYRSAIGELLFAAITCRPYVMYGVIKLSRFPQRPRELIY